ncbi:hypothetical protein EZS27_026787 [termite gut metagenome]|uniref:Uncharacterized protein n=1 Tax=termite gut metagenome TaxID=433724 RepID=A0A5J4QRA6_9ZZZZ
MEQLTGIEYEKDVTGRTRYVRIDIDKHGENKAFQDFLDSIEIMSQKGEETVTLQEFNRYIDERLAQCIKL